MECVKVTAGVRKPKKKQVKDELDRIKQAEKKKRRLEKALATSAAIRSELEKKKLKKKEEQERLDEEGAAIAEAVALQVLLDEDSDDSKKKDEGLTSRDHASNIGFIMGPTQQPHSYNLSKYSCQNVGRVFSDYNQHGRRCNLSGYSNPRYFGQGVWGSVGLSADHLAAQAVSSLRIGDDARVNAFFFNPFVRG
ncbi:hypothetical protein PHJA_001279300 [Phtheirospermum japonicum]|uniref:Uncharacterized protein n=1 Tax=Phtheirospermum japonicum TaxID=374723 RepID=A0A830C5G0_9LAMI|nr:hypothetical protein PHJA_001279300 [Phtheirospermum japonicum]